MSNPVPYNAWSYGSYGSVMPRRPELPPTKEYAISDRRDFTSTDYLSSTTEIGQIVSRKPYSLQNFDAFNPSEFYNKRVFILVHGFTAKYEEVIDALDDTSKKVKGVYDVVIAYLYPAQSILFYYTARKIARKVALTSFLDVINKVSYLARYIDMVGHSMGVYSIMNVLNNPSAPKIRNLFLLGGADRQENLLDCAGSGCSKYPTTLKKVEQIWVLFSCKDATLLGHTLFTGERSQGRLQWIDLRFLPKNVKLVNCTKSVHGHREYLTSLAVAQFMNEIGTRQTFYPGDFFILDSSGSLHQVAYPLFCPRTGVDALASIANVPIKVGRALVDAFVGIASVPIKAAEALSQAAGF